MSIVDGLVRVGFSVFREFRNTPERQAKRLARKNRRRAKKGLPPIEPQDVEESNMFDGYKTYLGIAVLVLTPLAARYGVSSAEVSAWVTAIGTVVGGILAAYGRYVAKPKA